MGSKTGCNTGDDTDEMAHDTCDSDGTVKAAAADEGDAVVIASGVERMLMEERQCIAN